jgi:hypothetical protein
MFKSGLKPQVYTRVVLPLSRAVCPSSQSHEEDTLVNLAPHQGNGTTTSPRGSSAAEAAVGNSFRGSSSGIHAAAGVPGAYGNDVGSRGHVGAGDALGAYGAALQVCDSDHKPVWCTLQVQLPAHVQQQRRQHSEQVSRSEGVQGQVSAECVQGQVSRSKCVQGQ